MPHLGGPACRCRTDEVPFTLDLTRQAHAYDQVGLSTPKPPSTETPSSMLPAEPSDAGPAAPVESSAPVAQVEPGLEPGLTVPTGPVRPASASSARGPILAMAGIIVAVVSIA